MQKAMKKGERRHTSKKCAHCDRTNKAGESSSRREKENFAKNKNNKNDAKRSMLRIEPSALCGRGTT